jgi:type III pantothenate kinase
MDLILDLGNTNKKIALFDEGRLLCIQSHERLTITLLRNLESHYPGISSCILSSVVRVPPSLLRFLEKHFRLLVLDENTPLPVQNHYLTPDTLGKDRLAAAVGGNHEFPGQPVLVITAGTAITYDLITAEGIYSGGSITPGMNMRFRALHTFTRRLPLLSYREIGTQPGNDTETAILTGVINGIVAEMEGFSTVWQKDYPGLKVILSGGDLNYFVNRLKISIFAVPNIVIHGLHQILLFNE